MGRRARCERAPVDRTCVAECQWVVTVRPSSGELESVRVRSSELVARVDFEDDVTEEEADRHTRDLVLLLEDLDVDEVRVAEGGAVPGSRSADPGILAGAVLVSGVLLKPVLTSLVSLVGSWLEQSEQRSVTVELGGAKVTVKGRVSPEDVQTYVRALRGEVERSTGETVEEEA